MLLLHQEQRAFDEALPVLNKLLVDVQVVCPGYHVVSLVEIFLPNANFQNLFDSLGDEYLVVVQLYALVKVQQRFGGIRLLQVRHRLVVERLAAGAVSLQVQIQVAQSEGVVALLVIAYSSLQVGYCTQICLQRLCECQNGLINPADMLEAVGSTDIREPFKRSLLGGQHEVCCCLLVVSHTHVQLRSVHQAVVVLWEMLEPTRQDQYGAVQTVELLVGDGSQQIDVLPIVGLLLHNFVEDIYALFELTAIHVADSQQILGLHHLLLLQHPLERVDCLIQLGLLVVAAANLQQRLHGRFIRLLPAEVVAAYRYHSPVLLNFVRVGQGALGMAMQAGRMIVCDAARSHFVGLVQQRLPAIDDLGLAVGVLADALFRVVVPQIQLLLGPPIIQVVCSYFLFEVGGHFLNVLLSSVAGEATVLRLLAKGALDVDGLALGILRLVVRWFGMPIQGVLESVEVLTGNVRLQQTDPRLLQFRVSLHI